MNYKCPVCGCDLTKADGDRFHPNDPKFGAYLYCPSPTCPAQEVCGHGKNVKEAFDIVTSKYIIKKK
jgi:hypothetical protein